MSANMFKDERIWRTLANVWTFFVAIFIVFDFFSFNKYHYLASIFSVIYAAILSTYIGAKEFKRWSSHYEGRHFGGWFAIGWTALIVFLISAKLILGGKYSVSPEALADYVLVISLFALTQRLKLAYAKKKEENNGMKIAELFFGIGKLLKITEEKLKRYPIIYAVLGAVGIILFWRGIWYLADFVFPLFINGQSASAMGYIYFWDGLLSTIIGFAFLLVTGLFVSDFIGSTVIKTEELVEETEKEVEETEKEEKAEEKRLEKIEKKFEEVTGHLDEHLEKIEKKLKKKKK